MSLSIVIVGRPNVGKSTLFNRLVGRRLALVDDRPGVTRDRREGEGRLGDIEFTVIDTAGLEQAAPESLSGRMRAQTEAAIDQADIIFFMIDARAGPTPVDRDFADVARKSGKPIVLIANKSEGTAGEAGRLDAYCTWPWRADPDLGRARRGHVRSLRCLACFGAGRTCPGTGRRRVRPAAPDPRRHCRPSQRREIDADQPADRRGAAAYRTGGRHHARCHRCRARLARSQVPDLRHSRIAPPLARRGKAGEAFCRGCTQRGSFR